MQLLNLHRSGPFEALLVRKISDMVEILIPGAPLEAHDRFREIFQVIQLRIHKRYYLESL
jgi:hypothetical protein